ncbi:14658_t:CDS:1, partial [Funneliformis mosseae]
KEFNQKDLNHEYLNKLDDFNDDEWKDMNSNNDNSTPVNSSSI